MSFLTRAPWSRSPRRQLIRNSFAVLPPGIAPRSFRSKRMKMLEKGHHSLYTEQQLGGYRYEPTRTSARQPANN
jgi:hypothetical protein